MKRDKPVLHGFDHAEGGADPIPAAAAAASAEATPIMAVAYREAFDVPTTPGGSSANFDPWDYIDVVAGATDIDLDGSSCVRINTTGLYLCIPVLQVFDTIWLSSATMDLNFQFLTGGLSNSMTSTWPGNTTTVGPTGVAGTTRAWQIFANIYVNIITAPEVLRVQALQVSGGSTHTATSTFASMSVQRIPGPVPDIALN